MEYLSENYEVEKELAKGKYIADYDRRITYPVGVHIYFEGQIHEVIRSMSGYRKPTATAYWKECIDAGIDAEQVAGYSQLPGRQGELQWCGLHLSGGERLQVRRHPYPDGFRVVGDGARTVAAGRVPVVGRG